MSKEAEALLEEAVLYHHYGDGSFADKSGNGNDGTPTDVYLTNSGIKTSSVSGSVVVNDSPEIQLTEGCIIILADFTSQTPTEVLLAKRDSGGTNYQLQVTTDTIQFFDGTSIRSRSSVNIVGKKYLGLNFGNASVGEVFLDADEGLLLNGSSTVAVDDAPLTIGNYGALNNVKSNIKSALVFPRKLTATEHAILYGYLSSLVFVNLKEIVVVS